MKTVTHTYTQMQTTHTHISMNYYYDCYYCCCCRMVIFSVGLRVFYLLSLVSSEKFLILREVNRGIIFRQIFRCAKCFENIYSKFLPSLYVIDYQPLLPLGKSLLSQLPHWLSLNYLKCYRSRIIYISEKQVLVLLIFSF